MTLQLIDGLWVVLDNDSYEMIHSDLPPYLYSEVDGKNSLRYYPVYFPVGCLIEFMKERGYQMELIYQ